MVSIRPQRDKRPPAWLEDFITDGELEQSIAIQPEAEIVAAHSVKMAQRQLEHPPAINIQDMWHLSDDEERRERRLPGEGLDNRGQILRTYFIPQPLRRASVPWRVVTIVR